MNSLSVVLCLCFCSHTNYCIGLANDDWNAFPANDPSIHSFIWEEHHSYYDVPEQQHECKNLFIYLFALLPFFLWRTWWQPRANINGANDLSVAHAHTERQRERLWVSESVHTVVSFVQHHHQKVLLTQMCAYFNLNMLYHHQRNEMCVRIFMYFVVALSCIVLFIRPHRNSRRTSSAAGFTFCFLFSFCVRLCFSFAHFLRLMISVVSSLDTISIALLTHTHTQPTEKPTT